MAPIFRTVGLLFLLPVAMIIARYAAFPFGHNPGPVSGFVLRYGGYFVLVAYAICFVAVGYQLSKHRVGSIFQAGALCVIAYIVLVLFASVVWKLVSGVSVLLSTDFAYIAQLFTYLVGAFSLGAGGFLLHARFLAAAK